MSEMIVIKKVALNERHLRPGRIRHTICDKHGEREFPPFVSLVITQTVGHSETIMWRLCEDGSAAHTHHGMLDEALDQAEFEFEIKQNEWIATNEPFLSLKEYTKRKEGN